MRHVEEVFPQRDWVAWSGNGVLLAIRPPPPALPLDIERQWAEEGDWGIVTVTETLTLAGDVGENPGIISFSSIVAVVVVVVPIVVWLDLEKRLRKSGLRDLGLEGIAWVTGKGSDVRVESTWSVVEDVSDRPVVLTETNRGVLGLRNDPISAFYIRSVKVQRRDSPKDVPGRYSILTHF